MASSKFGYATFTTNPYPNGKFANPQSIMLQGGVTLVASSLVTSITAWTATGNTYVFTATNTLAVGNAIYLTNFPTTKAFNGQWALVTARTGSNFTVVIPGLSTAASGTENANAVLISPLATLKITAWSITTNVVTFTVANTLAAGDIVNLSGFGTSTFFNGQAVTVLAGGLSASQFTANFTHADGSGAEAGIGTVQASYAAGGIPCAWFPQTNAATGILEYPVVGPNFMTGGPALPLTGSVLFQSQIAGTNANYSYDPVHNTLRITVDSTGAELAATTVPTADTIGYSAAFHRV